MLSRVALAYHNLTYLHFRGSFEPFFFTQFFHNSFDTIYYLLIFSQDSFMEACRCTPVISNHLIAPYTWELRMSRFRVYDALQFCNTSFSTAFSRTGKLLSSTLIVYYPSATVFNLLYLLHFHLSIHQHSSQVMTDIV